MKKIFSFCLAALLILAGCGSQPASSAAESSGTAESVSSEAAGSASSDVSSSEDAASEEPVTILVAAAASLEYSFVDELIPMFQEKYPYITVEGTYDSSGKLQTQIEEGLEADVFMSAATKQMNALKDESLVDADSIVNLLENKIVLITAADSTSPVTTFEEIGNAQSIALGDPASVPVGQYAQEALTTLGLWDAIQPKVSLGTNVTEVLNWVAEGSADAGIVYATDAATTDKVTVVAEAPEGSLAEPVIYPVGVVSASQHKDAAALFVEFLQSPEALAVFEAYGFSAA
ncbi:molybdate ABC transporter substrate-binding protein [Angelakisella massiliensis]|uniref:molybdate ABC transporter substrate-binding protein n=1 Tax=Angelakisella massiliensis TaxID=1871018 RepID=UPI0024B08183|nr:molybdate ABC transporter substrate-binding protein [Angelakisella massiliensis]